MKSLEGLKHYQLLITAWKSGLFDYTVTPKTSQEIAKELGYHKKMTQMFLDALIELGLLTTKGNTYANSQLASNYLTSSSSLYLTHTLQNMEKTAKLWSQLATILKDGPVTQDKNDRFGANWIASIAESAEAGSVSNVVKAVSMYLNINRWRRLLDIGGGHGLYSIAFAALNPELEAFVFDRPNITSITCKHIDAYEAAHVNVISGDFYVDSIGECYDAIFSSFNQSCGDPKLIPKMVDALNPDGDLVLRRFKDETREGALKILDWNLLHFEGKELGSKPHSACKVVKKDEYLKHLKDAGLTILDIIPVDDMSEIVFARKSSNRSEN
jgi:precorrin-6B methylase 2